MKRWLLPIAIGLSLVACGDDSADAGGGTTGGSTPQGGSPSEGGNAPQGGTAPEGGNGTGGGTAPEGGNGTGGAPTENPLGDVCGDGLPECPAPTDCVIQPLIGGSETQGYCSPACTEPTDCTDGFEGPGETTCYGGTCVFTCVEDEDCPEGLSCLATGGPTSACGVAAK